MLSQCQQGANFAFNAVPSQARGAMLPMSFVTACQLHLRLPLSLLQGITTCVCGAAVDCYGALGKEAMGFFKECRKKVSNELGDRDAARATWSSWGFSNFYLQSSSVANLKGQGNFFASAAAILRARGGVRLIG